jgi:signal transduction histidine kinase
MRRLLPYLERMPRPAIMAATLLIVVVVGMIDFLSGYEISFSVFYLAAIALATWSVGKGFGWLVSVLSVISWLVGDLAAGATYSNRFVPIWNVIIALVFYLVLVEVLAILRVLQRNLEAKVVARTAALTEEMVKRQALEKELLAVGERERQRIGHDLHDSLCQHLPGQCWARSWRRNRFPRNPMPRALSA